MDPKDMLDMLGLNDPLPVGNDSVKIVGVDPAAPGGDYTVLTEVHRTALKLDEWDLERGREIGQRHLDRPEGNVDPLDPMEWADLHGAVYKETPQLVEHCQDGRRWEFVKGLLEDPQFTATRASTVLNLAAAEAATEALAARYFELLQKDQKRKQKCKGRKLSKAEEQTQQIEAAGDLLAAVVGAAREAGEAVEEQEEACRSLGVGQGNDGRIDPAKIAALHKRVRGNKALRRITELAGKFRRLAQAKQRQKVAHGYDDVVGVELAGDVGRLLPSELAKLSDPLFEDDVLRRLAERQTMCREHRGAEPVGKGPIVVVVDESGSMSGEPVYAAKAFALAMAWIAKKQNRWCALVGFSGGTEGTLCVLKPGKWDEAKLMEWLVHFYGGGTTCDVPLVQLPGAYWQQMEAPKGKTDVVFITDGVIDVPWEVRKSFNEWKLREKVRAITLVMGGYPGGMNVVSDEVHLISGVSVAEEAIGRCLSV